LEEPYSAELIRNLNALHDLLSSEETAQEPLQRVSELALATIEGADGVGVTLVDNGNAKTTAATDDFTLKIDGDQYENGEGPCLEAYETKRTIFVKDIEADGRWPAFARAASRDGLASSMSFPISVRDKGAGALNIYARTKNAFGDKSRAVGELFASQASVALTNAQVYAASLTLAEQLREAIKSREIIGQAKGLLMAREGVSDDEAFEMLKRVSQNQNVKLRDIAQKIVDDAAKKT